MSDNVCAIIDADFIKYSVAAVGEKRSIVVTHLASGREMEFSNRTAFYGSNREGGWLAERNAGRTSPFTIDEFRIEDVQTPEPIENALHIVKLTFNKILKALGTDQYKAFVGQGDPFRVERSTIIKYKGNRVDRANPVHLDAITNYLVNKYKAEIVTGIESDDRCVMECYGNNNNILVAIDKDAYGTPAKVYNPNKPDDGIIDCDVFGELRRDSKGKVRGHGRLFFYFQVASGDAIDNYKANSASDKKWGDVSAYNRLVGCKTDAEALEALYNIYDQLYPEAKVVTGWRGDEIEIDGSYMLDENWDLARMLRWGGDVFSFDDAVRFYL